MTKDEWIEAMTDLSREVADLMRIERSLQAKVKRLSKREDEMPEYAAVLKYLRRGEEGVGTALMVAMDETDYPPLVNPTYHDLLAAIVARANE